MKVPRPTQGETYGKGTMSGVGPGEVSGFIRDAMPTDSLPAPGWYVPLTRRFLRSISGVCMWDIRSLLFVEGLPMPACGGDRPTISRHESGRPLAIALLLSLLGLSLCGCHLELSREGVPEDIDSALVEDQRAGWLRDRVIEDNRDLFERYPELSEGKMLKMALNPYNYFRGTATIYLRDAMQPGPHNIPTSYGTADASLVHLVGDPHPENIGSYRAGNNRMTIDFNDFDAATHGPYHLDVRRLALGFYVVGEMAADWMSEEERRAMLEAVAGGYVDEIERIAAGEAPTDFTYTRGAGVREAGEVLGDLIRRAERDGDSREELDEYTVIQDGTRVMFYGTIEGPEAEGVFGDTLLEPDDTQRERVIALLADYPDTLVETNSLRDNPAAFTIKGISRRLGAGVSSYPVQRYYVLIEGATGDIDDDVLLEVKEILDAPHFENLTAFGLRAHPSNGARVSAAQRALQHYVDNDPMLGWGSVGLFSVRVRDRVKYQKGADHARIIEHLKEGGLSADDVVEFAGQAGVLLARTHASAETLRGLAGAPTISAALGGDREGFVDETLGFIEQYGPVTLDDYDRFRAALAIHGPYLGYRFSRSTE